MPLTRTAQQARGVSLIGKAIECGGTNAIGSVTADNGSHSFSVGDLVYIAHPGVWSTRVSVPATALFKLPSIPADRAYFLPAFLSAWGILSLCQSLQKGTNVVQLSSDKLIGQAIELVGRTKGCTVITLGDSDITSAARLKELPKVPYVISGTPGNQMRSLLRVLGSHGTAIYYDGSIQNDLNARGIEIPVSSAIFQDQKVVGFDLLSWTLANRSEVESAIGVFVDLSQRGDLPNELPSMPFAEAIRVLEDYSLESRSFIVTL